MSTKCISPFGVKDKMKNQTISVPCGKCPPCKARRASNWSVRLIAEEKQADIALFVTLTYTTEHVPITPRGFMSLDKTDFQKFMKRLRKEAGTTGIKYYCVGEYGGKTMRPHYHMIIFNCKIDWIENNWKKGQTHYGEVTGASIGYTLKYISKDGKIPLHKNDDRVPEFALMSKGLGKNYLTPKIIAWHLKDPINRNYVPVEGGKKAPLPRYFKDHLYGKKQSVDTSTMYPVHHGQPIIKAAIAHHAKRESKYALLRELTKDSRYFEKESDKKKAIISTAKKRQNKHCKL